MSQISIQNLSFSYPGSHLPVFRELSLSLDTGWRLGLVGRNGRGKTTLLKLLAGELTPDPGSILLCPAAAQQFPFPVKDPGRPALEVLREAVAPFRALEEEMEAALREGTPEALLRYGEAQEQYQNAGGYVIDELICREAGKLEVREGALERPFDTLSPGERVKLLLGVLFLRPEGFLLIDEPTSHLDARGRRVVGEYLSQGGKGFLLVSHDRDFLDAAADHILALNRTTADLIQGNYSVWEREKDRKDALELAQKEKLTKEAARLAEAARRASGWSDALEATKKGLGQDSASGLRPDRGHIGAKSARMMKRAKAIQTRRQEALAETRTLLRDLEETEALKLHILPTRRSLLLRADGLSADYGTGPVFPPVSFQLEPGERLALTGPNGCGKSTLLALLLGREIPCKGELWRAGDLTISSLPQDCSGLSGSLEDYAQAQGVDGDLMRAILRKLDFPRDLLALPMEGYSAGQKKKAALAASLAKPAHLFLWDEPLNYIDLLSRRQLEDLLLEAAPAMVLVEHDRRFVRQVCSRELPLDRA